MRETLTHVSLATLRDLRRAVDHGIVAVPLTPLLLRARGLDEATAEHLAHLLGPLPRPSLLAVLGALIAERERAEQRRPRLLWTGPEATGTTALDTRVQLLHLFESARKSAFIAGYLFDDPTLLRPLADATAARGLDVAFVLDIRAAGEGTRDHRIRAQVAKFLREIWPRHAPRPRVYVDPRTAAWNPDPNAPNAGYYVSMHAKAVVIDAEHTILGSANFTDRGTDRNIEAGVLLRSPEFARTLLAQWEALIAAGLLHRVDHHSP
ncbi:MAG: hypothetical protein IPK80_34810 [Nannocystis sp.]|nr:hypothetical protein [Nannocystis sp.]